MWQHPVEIAFCTFLWRWNQIENMYLLRLSRIISKIKFRRERFIFVLLWKLFLPSLSNFGHRLFHFLKCKILRIGCIFIVVVTDVKFVSTWRDKAKKINGLYSCDKITRTWIQISRQNWNGFFSNISHPRII